MDIINNKPVRQHHVPQTYLHNFCDRKNLISVFDKNNMKIFTTGLTAVGVEKNFYTLDDNIDPYCWEKRYSKEIEPLMSKLLPRIIELCNGNMNYQNPIISEVWKKKLALIIITQLLRSKQTRIFSNKISLKVVPNILKRAEYIFGRKIVKENNLYRILSEEDNMYIKDALMNVCFNDSMIKKLVNELSKLKFLLLKVECNCDFEFITSDNPTMLMNIRTLDVTSFSNGISNPETIICYPLNPKILLLALHSQYTSYNDCSLIKFEKNIERLEILNLKQIEQSVNQNYAKSIKILEEFKSNFD